MPPTSRRRPRLFVDADALFAGAAAPSDHGASLVILRLAEITLIEAVTLQQAVTEAERNLGEKLPQALPAFRLIVSRCLRVVPDPRPGELLAQTPRTCPFWSLPCAPAARGWSRSTLVTSSQAIQMLSFCGQGILCCACGTC